MTACWVREYVIGFFKWPNPSSRIMTQGSTQPLTEMSTTDLDGVKGRPARKADNLTAIFWSKECENLEVCRPPRSVTGIALPFHSFFTSLLHLSPISLIYLSLCRLLNFIFRRFFICTLFSPLLPHFASLLILFSLVFSSFPCSYDFIFHYLFFICNLFPSSFHPFPLLIICPFYIALLDFFT
jgi:hypothetical protein